MTDLCIVPCGKEKIWKAEPLAGPTVARRVYTGRFAGTCIRYAEAFYPKSYVILSAKYGFLAPDDLIEGDYNVTFKDQSTNPISLEVLVRTAGQKRLFGYRRIVAVVGKDYLDRIESVFPGILIVTPLAGCKNMGEMIGKLKKAISSGRPL